MRRSASATAKRSCGSFLRRSRADGRCGTRDSSSGELALTQQFQRVGGTLTLRGNVQPVLGAYVEGDVLGFTFVDLDGGIRSVRARVDGGTLAGSLRFAGSLTTCHRPEKIGTRHRLHAYRCLGLAAAACLAARAGGARPGAGLPLAAVKVIVPFSPGGAVDGPMRVIAQELGKRLGQQVVVENKPGAGATIGSELVAKRRARRLHAAARVADQCDQRVAVHEARRTIRSRTSRRSR